MDVSELQRIPTGFFSLVMQVMMETPVGQVAITLRKACESIAPDSSDMGLVKV